MRGNVNDDDSVNVADGVYMLNALFSMGPLPDPEIAADVNDDGEFDVADPTYLLNFLFNGGPQPPFPFPEPGCL